MRRLWALALLGAGAGEESSCDAALKVKLQEGTSLLDRPVFYGRPLLRIPKTSLLEAGEELQGLRKALADRPLGLGQEEATEQVLLAAALLRRRRSGDVALADELPPLALQLSPRQISILAGTTVEDLPEQAQQLAAALVALGEAEEDAAWALGVVLRRAIYVTTEDGRRVPRLALVPELLSLRPHPDPSQVPPFHEKLVNLSGEERSVLLQAAQRDYRAGEEIFRWTGRFSDSELLLRGIRHEMKNPIGVGGKDCPRLPLSRRCLGRAKPQQPKKGGASCARNSNPKTPNYKEFRRFDCTSQEAFEVRLSKKGWPMRSFVRCYRVAWLLLNGHYNPKVIELRDLLEKWPPPKKYSHSEWLAWTQADQAVNTEIQQFCQAKRSQLKESISSSMAEDFRNSHDPTDQLLWRLRSEESKAFKECVSLAKSTGIPR